MPPVTEAKKAYLKQYYINNKLEMLSLKRRVDEIDNSSFQMTLESFDIKRSDILNEAIDRFKGKSI